ncbi:BGBP protein, partial [Pseudoatta argentina]
LIIANMLSRRVDHAIVQLIFVLTCILVKSVFPYVLPNPIFEVLKPQGLRVSIPDAPGLRIFGFHANINKAIRTNEYGQIAGDTYLATDDRWTFEDSDVTIKNGDVLHYWIYVQVNGINHKKNNQIWTCTSLDVFECTRQASSFSILPPVISTRFTTKEHFVLQYGKIEIRAKFPEGDWLYPEMWLEPRYSIYGMNYASGRVLLGLTRGNENLVNATDVSKIYDTRRLDFGVRVSPSFNEIQEILVTKVNEFGPRWTKDFHVYTTIWTSDGFTFLVDGEEVGRISPNEEGWMSGPHADRKAAPFDQEAMLNFWNSRNQWLPSWRRDSGSKTAFVIDYVKVWAS